MAPTNRIRADIALVNAGLAESRTKAQALIIAGQVWLGDQRVQKSSDQINSERLDQLDIRRPNQGFVGRGAGKIAPVISQAGWCLDGANCLDIGASTGGFTEVLLDLGAATVWSLDVGYGQLHPRLRQDKRVVVLERTNFRHWSPPDGAPPFAFAVMDVSFISVTLLLDRLFQALAQQSNALVLVKPQFEVGREHVPRGGVIKDELLIRQTIDRVAAQAESCGFAVVDRIEAAQAGRKGNQETFLHLGRP